MKTSKSYCYLSAQDSRTSRLELVAFAGLGLAGAALIASALSNSLQFAEAHESIIEAWSAPTPTRVEVAGRSPDPVLTNLLPVHTAPTRTPPHASLQTPPSAAVRVRKPACRALTDGALPLWSVRSLEW